MMAHMTVIEAGKSPGMGATLRAIWQYRALLLALSKRDVSVKFKQAAIGIVWVILQPLVSAAIFGIFARFESGELPYPVFAFSGMVLWHFFSRSTSEGASSLVSNAHLLTKVYFPRALLPLVPVFAASVDFLFATLFMVLTSVAIGVPIAWTVPLTEVRVALR